MKKKTLFLVPFCLLGTAGCDNYGFYASLADNIVNKVIVGSTINFNNYLSYDNDVSLDITYSTEKVTNKECQSIYFLTTEVSVHNFTFSFSKDGKTKTLTCSINVVAKAPTVVESTNAVFVNKGDTVDFVTIFNDSGIDAMPFGYVNVDFIGVRYTPCYANEYVSLSEDEESIYSPINKGTIEYSFNEYGKYIFDLDIHNSEGHIFTNLQVSVLDNNNQVIEGMESKGLVKGDNNIVQLVRSNSMSNLSYLYYNESLVLDETKEYTISSEFFGKSAPQVMLLADAKNGKKYSGKGFIISLEEDSKNQFGIFGYERLNSTNQSPKRSEGNTFSRKTLLDGINYKWDITFRKTKQSDENYKLAIKSDLYKNNELYRSYSYVSFDIPVNNEESYFGYLGSSLDDVTFRYSSITIKEAN